MKTGAICSAAAAVARRRFHRVGRRAPDDAERTRVDRRERRDRAADPRRMGARRPDEDRQRRARARRADDARADQRARGAGARSAAALAERLHHRAAHSRRREPVALRSHHHHADAGVDAAGAVGRAAATGLQPDAAVHQPGRRRTTTSATISAAPPRRRTCRRSRTRGPVFNTFPQPQVVNPQTGAAAAFPVSSRRDARSSRRRRLSSRRSARRRRAPYGGVAVPGMVAPPPPDSSSRARCSRPGQRPATAAAGQPVGRPGGANQQ